MSDQIQLPLPENIKVTSPRININGTDGKDLLQQWMDAHAALNKAHEALLTAMPHGRDFQTVAQEFYRLARDEHIDRLKRLERISAEVEQIALNLLEQIGSRT